MQIPSGEVLLQSVSALPAGAALVERVRDQGGIHLVGGAVRDLLLEREPTELDLVVEEGGEQLVRELGGSVVRHERFGTWTVVADGFSYDIAQARTETYPDPGALPEVAPGTLAEDLLRRDFTVNAVALALGGPEAGRLTAAPLALEDLELHRLRVLHDKSFIDDPTRLLRLARYLSRLGFAVEDHTASLAAQAVAERALESVSGSRVGAELRLLTAEPDPVAALRALDELGLARQIDPNFDFTAADADLARSALALLPAEGRGDRLALAVAAREIAPSELRELLDRLAFDAEDREAIVAAATRAEEVSAELAEAERPSQVAQAAEQLPLELVALAGALGPEHQARTWLEDLRHVRVEIAGDDLLAAGVPQGPAIGRGLRAALAARLDGRAQGRQEELTVALEAARGTG
jgi:tRNA nucleotidyltransferase (CCA-adding enzyme)